MNRKRLISIAAAILGVLAILGIGVGRLFLDHWHRYEPMPAVSTEPLIHQIASEGFSPAVADSVRRLALPQEIPYLYIAAGNEPRQVLAATNTTLEGKSHRDLQDGLITQGWEGSAQEVSSPDGTAYLVVTARLGPTLPGRVGAPAFLAGLVAAALAWLCLAAWIYLDAQERGSTAAPGWALLGVLAAPLALAVWLINRPAPKAEAQPICPGCGADTTKDGAFCVRCGYALQPTCPDCKRPVAADWTYCAACGNNLVE